MFFEISLHMIQRGTSIHEKDNQNTQSANYTHSFNAKGITESAGE